MYEIFKIKVLQDVKNTPVFLLDIERECESVPSSLSHFRKISSPENGCRRLGTIMRKKYVTLIQDQKNGNFIRK